MISCMLARAHTYDVTVLCADYYVIDINDIIIALGHVGNMCEITGSEITDQTLERRVEDMVHICSSNTTTG